MQSPRIALVVVTYNGRAFLDGLLESIRLQTYENVEVIVVDNASLDGTRDMLSERAGGNFRTILNEKNEGCARAFNQGAEAAVDADYVCFLNQDTVLDPDYCEAVRAAFAADPAIGIVQPLVRFADRSAVENCGHTVDAWMSTETLGHRSATVPAIPTGLMLTITAGAVRQSMLRAIGGFDEELFIYYEDTDCSLRVWKAHGRVVFEPKALVSHIQAATAGKESREWHAFLYARNRIRLLWKHADDAQSVARLVTAIVGGCAIGIAMLVSFRREGPAVLRGVAWNVRNWRSNEKARRELLLRGGLKNRELQDREIMRSRGGPFNVIRRAFEG